MRLTLVTLLAAAAVLVFAAAPAHAAKAINGRCGLHYGALIRRNQGGSLYHARLGPLDGHHGGVMHCRGLVRVRQPGAAPDTPTIVWRRYDLRGWNYHLIVLTTTKGGVTATACAEAGKCPPRFGWAPPQCASPCPTTRRRARTPPTLADSRLIIQSG